MHVSAMQMKHVFLVFTKIVPKYLSLTCTIRYHFFLHNTTSQFLITTNISIHVGHLHDSPMHNWFPVSYRITSPILLNECDYVNIIWHHTIAKQSHMHNAPTSVRHYPA